MVKSKKIKLKSENEGIEELKSQLARALADYDNLSKRIAQERSTVEKIAASKVVLKLLPVFDMLIDAQKHIKDAGLEIVLGEFRKSLFELGIEEISVNQGDNFNPLRHEAIELVAGGKENTIAALVQGGWKIRDQDYIIRPAKVKVYKMSN